MADDRRPVSRLDITGPAHIVAERWRKWRRSLEFYLAGQDIDNPARKRSLLLHYAGTAVQDIYEGLQGTEDENKNDVYVRTATVLEDHFRAEPNIPFERYAFRQMSQKPSETMDQFVARLRQQVQLSDFQDLNDQLRDQLIEKMLDHKLRRKLLETRNITLENALTTARAWEAADQQSRGMQASPASSAAANAISKQTTKRRPPTSHADAGAECHNCGRTGHFARDPNCPAKGKMCAHC